MLEAGVLIDASRSSAVDFDLEVIEFAMDEGYLPVESAEQVWDLLQVEPEDQFQVLSEIADEAITWMNACLLMPADHYIGFSEHESNVLLIMPREDA